MSFLENGNKVNYLIHPAIGGIVCVQDLGLQSFLQITVIRFSQTQKIGYIRIRGFSYWKTKNQQQNVTFSED